jgi:hypothetical protein
VAEDIKAVRVVRGKRDGEAWHRCGDRGHVRPEFAAPHPVPRERRGGQSGRCDEPGERDVQVCDVVVQRGLNSRISVRPTSTWPGEMVANVYSFALMLMLATFLSRRNLGRRPGLRSWH